MTSRPQKVRNGVHRGILPEPGRVEEPRHSFTGNGGQPNKRAGLIMTDHPNATDYRNRAERAEAEANELRAALKIATDGLQAICDCDVSDPVDYVRRCDAVACDALVKIEALA